MLPISSIMPQAMSAYGITPQSGAGAPMDITPKMPGMPAMTDFSSLPGMSNIPAISDAPGQVTSMPAPTPSTFGGHSSGDSFGSMLGKLVSDVNAKQVDAGNAVASLQAGGNVSLHQAVISMEEANVSFQLMVEVRNKLLEAYQEIMRMQV